MPDARDMERLWREKSDEDLLEAAATLGDFTDEGQQVIRAELRRRGLEDPVDQARETTAEVDGEPEGVAAEEGALPVPDCPRCDVAMKYHGTRVILGSAGELFKSADDLDVYVCPRCGRVELFMVAIGDEQAGES